MGEGRGDQQLHAHPLGERLDLLARGQGKARKVAAVQIAVPLAVRRAADLAHLLRRQRLVEVHAVQHHADVLPQRLGGGKRLPPEGHIPRVPADEVEQGVDGGALSRAVFADQAHDLSLGQGEGDVVQRKVRVALCQVLHLQNGFHGHSPS